MNLQTKLQNLRDEFEITQNDIANILKVSRSSYNNYEHQYDIIPLKRLNMLCNYYNVSIDYIFSFNESKQYKNSKSEIDYKTVSIRLKEFRKEHNLTQVKLANILNIGNGTIAEYERGNFLISTASLYTICKKYNISADYLLGKIDTK